jgi:hypothetical protein
MWNSSPSSAKSSERSHQNIQAREEKTRLPDNFTPSPYTVLIGRGKACAEALGNKRLKVIVSTYLDEYSNAPNRISRSIIVSKIVDIFREACPVGSFVKKEDEAWWEVSDLVARERVGSMLRDSLHEQYKSSSKSKLARRQTSTMDTMEGHQVTTKNQKAMQPALPPPFLFLYNPNHQQQDEEQNSIQPTVSRNSMFRTPNNMELQMMQVQWENSMHRRQSGSST